MQNKDLKQDVEDAKETQENLQAEVEDAEDRTDDIMDKIDDEQDRNEELKAKVAEVSARVTELVKERREAAHELELAQEKLKARKLTQLRSRKPVKGAWWPPDWFGN